MSDNAYQQAYLQGTTLAGNLTYLTGNFSVSYTEIGPVDVSLFMNLLNELFDRGIVPMVNLVLKQGFVLPTIQGTNCLHVIALNCWTGVTFVNPTIGWADGYLYVSTDITYTPPAMEAEEVNVPPSNVKFPSIIIN
jgi:hypothetical protein